MSGLTLGEIDGVGHAVFGLPRDELDPLLEAAGEADVAGEKALDVGLVPRQDDDEVALELVVRQRLRERVNGFLREDRPEVPLVVEGRPHRRIGRLRARSRASR